MVATLIGSIYFGQKLDQDGVMNINGALFLFLTNMTFQNVFAVINVFSAEVPIFLREKRSRLFRVDTYFLGKTIAELPLFILVPLVFTSIAYPMIGLRPGLMHFLTAAFIVTLVANVATSFGELNFLLNNFVRFQLICIIFRLFHLLRQFVNFHGSFGGTAGHNSFPDLRWILSELGIGTCVLRIPVLPVMVPLR